MKSSTALAQPLEAPASSNESRRRHLEVVPDPPVADRPTALLAGDEATRELAAAMAAAVPVAERLRRESVRQSARGLRLEVADDPRRLTVYLERELGVRLARASVATRRSPTELVHDALDDLLEILEGPEPHELRS